MRYVIMFLFCFSVGALAEADIIFDYSLDEIEKIYLSDNDFHKRRVALGVINNIEYRQKEIIKIIEIGMGSADSEIKECSLSALHRLFSFQKSMAQKNGANDAALFNRYPAIVELGKRSDLIQYVEALTADRDAKVRNAAIITLDFGYGPSLVIKDYILNGYRVEPNLTNKRNLVRLLGRDEYANNKEVQSFLLDILDSEKTEASEIAAVILSKAADPVLAAMPKIMSLMESDERYADDDLLGAITRFGYHAESYLPRIERLRQGVDARLNDRKVSANFVRHSGFLKNKINSSVVTIASDVDRQKESVGAFSYAVTRIIDNVIISFSISHDESVLAEKGWSIKLFLFFCGSIFFIFFFLKMFRKRS